jgi:hypothetical protein
MRYGRVDYRRARNLRKLRKVTSSLADPAPRNPMIQRGVREVTVRRRTVGGMPDVCERVHAGRVKGGPFGSR